METQAITEPATSEQEYDLKKSTATIGALYPILKSSDGQILDGFHRQQSDPNWPSLVLENIATDEKKLIARLVANFHRREVRTAEKIQWINDLAKLYKEEGLRVEGPRTKRQGPNQIADKITETTGLARRTIMSYLLPVFKNGNMSRTEPDQHKTVNPSAGSIIFNSLSSRGEMWAQQTLDRYQEELKEQFLTSPLFRKQLLDHLPKSMVWTRKGHTVYRREPRPATAINIENDYEHFIQECPKCLCGQCSHKDSCLETPLEVLKDG